MAEILSRMLARCVQGEWRKSPSSRHDYNEVAEQQQRHYDGNDDCHNFDLPPDSSSKLNLYMWYGKNRPPGICPKMGQAFSRELAGIWWVSRRCNLDHNRKHNLTARKHNATHNLGYQKAQRNPQFRPPESTKQPTIWTTRKHNATSTTSTTGATSIIASIGTSTTSTTIYLL